MVKLTATRGLPSSGKSLWAHAQVAKDANTVLVSKDDLRRALFPGQGYSKDREGDRVDTWATRAAMKNALVNGEAVVFEVADSDGIVFTIVGSTSEVDALLPVGGTVVARAGGGLHLTASYDQ